MSQSKIKALQRFQNEKELREKVLIPLFERLNFHTVLNHGVREFGKDIILSKENAIGIKKYTALVVKKGNINVGAKGGQSSIEDVSRQAKEAFEIEYNDPSEKRKVKIDNVYVVCDGTISDNAQTKIVEQWGSSKDLYEKNTEFIPGDYLVKIIQDNWPIFFETNSPEYYEFAKSLIARLEDEERVKSLKIDENIHRISKEYMKSTLFEFQKKKDGSYSQQPRNADKVFEENRRILIVGESGTGKSHLLRKEIRKALSAEIEKEKDPRIKVYVKLSEFSTTCITSECIGNYLESYVSKIWDSAPKNYLENFHLEKRVDFYLDGYDEIPTDEKRKVAKGNIDFLLAEFPQSQFAITTREMSALFNQEFSESFKRFNLAQINYKEAIGYLESIIKDSSENGSEILKQIKQQEILLVLPRTPMTVQLVSSLFSESSSKEIPSNTTEVYRIFTELMLGRWDKQRDVTNSYDYEQKLSLLSEIAFFMQEEFHDYLLYEKAVEMAEDFMGSFGDSKAKGKGLLNEIIHRSELLVFDNGNVRFKHRSFQEFFCAHKIHNQGIDFKPFAAHAADPWWDNVIAFLCGFRKKADDIIRYVMSLERPSEIEEDIFRFRRGKNLGLYVRAGYQSETSVKKESLLQSIDDYDYCYSTEELEERIKKIIKRKPGKKSIHIILQLVLGNSYYSKLTEKAVFDLVSELEPRKLSYILKLVADFNNVEVFEAAVEKANDIKDIEMKKACAIVTNEFTRGEGVKLLESKEFRKLKKSAGIVLKPPTKKNK